MASRTWTCARCGVVASFQPDSTQPTRPEGWAKENGEWRCLGCRREEVVDAIPLGTGTEGRTQRRRALTEFELLRDPAATDQLIAKRARSSTAMVRPIRTALREAGKLPPEDSD